ncbi:MAG: hypothetical protein CVV25_08780 [Ignavibacteriae bacterium HGW-Ignavibacteriae-4]|jgi:hypothetical protein|nr:MAG: hypothetical protein CVV25_08780 [Ignavibacteriae bacterium HGW-Ignavibacteriae-4]
MKSIFTTLFLVLFALQLSAEAKAQSYTEAIIIEQPNDVIECEGSLDQHLFVVAAPSQKQYKIAYRWLKDDRPISNWVADFGQLTFDTLRYRMSGLYNAEIFAFDPNWTSVFGNPFNYDSARVSPVVSSDRVNLYVLQPPSFMKDIEYQIVKKDDDCIFTFDANIYGEHNMEDPTYWTDIQWFKDSVALIDGDRISGSQSSILTINNIEETDYSTKYRVRLSGDCDTIWSNEFAIYDEPKIVIRSHGSIISDSYCTNRNAPVIIYVGTYPPNLPIEYQWYMNDKPIYNELDKYEILLESTHFKDFEGLIIRVEWNSDFENERYQKYRVEMWPKGYKNNKTFLEHLRLRWVDPLELLTDLEDEYSVEEGQEITFEVEIKNTVRRYRWMKDDVETPVSDSVYKWKVARLEDSGIYYLEALNDCGSIFTKKTKLIVTKKPIITGIEDNSSQEISIYPNPLTANSTLTINPKSTGKVSVILADVLGNKLATVYDDMIQANQQQSINLNIDNIGLSSGTYYIIIQMGDKVETRQISVVR